MGHCWLNLGIQNKMVGHILLFYFTCSPKSPFKKYGSHYLKYNTLQISLTSIELVLSKTFSLFEKKHIKTSGYLKFMLFYLPSYPAAM